MDLDIHPEMLHACTDSGFQFDCYTERFNIGGFTITGKGITEFAFVFFRTYMVCFIKSDCPCSGKKAIFTEQNSEEFDQMSV